MAIFRKDTVSLTDTVSGYPDPYNQGSGNKSYRHLTEAGGLTQFGAALETLHPGKQSSQMHWEEHEDEFLDMLNGSLTVIENGDGSVIGPGDACCWKADVPVAHTLSNHTSELAIYLIVGKRHPENICHYPSLDMLATPQGFNHLDDTSYPRRKHPND